MDKTEGKTTIIDDAIPAGYWIDVKEKEKIQKYQDLQIELSRL